MCSIKKSVIRVKGCVQKTKVTYGMKYFGGAGCLTSFLEMWWNNLSGKGYQKCQE